MSDFHESGCNCVMCENELDRFNHCIGDCRWRNRNFVASANAHATELGFKDCESGAVVAAPREAG